jgi:hypothetical protein
MMRGGLQANSVSYRDDCSGIKKLDRFSILKAVNLYSLGMDFTKFNLFEIIQGKV